MDEGTLNDLLECSVCLERLDTSSRVLPCQHTFCKKCLQEIVDSHKELRCPECRILVPLKVEDLPPNVLLMRLLEGMRNAAPKKQHRTLRDNHTAPIIQHSTPIHHATADHRHKSNKQNSPHQIPSHQSYAKALYDFISKEPGDLNFKRDEIIILRKRIDTYWYEGECAGKKGVFPSSYVQIITPVPSNIPQCKALYDFRMTNDEEEGCLAFNKGDIISVIRRVDENWAEGKLDGRIGIFPLAFVELNNIARSLMKLSTNAQPGPSRVAPPTPTAEDSAPLIPTDHTRNVGTVHLAQPIAQSNTPKHGNSTQPVAGLPASDSSSTVSSGGSSTTTTPNTSSSNTSSSCSTAPSSPASPPPRTQTTNRISTQKHEQVLVSTPQRHAPPRPEPHSSHHNREKRHSFNSLTAPHHHTNTHRHSAEILSSETEGAAQSAHPERHRRNLSDANSMQLPAAYIALYPYKPQKSDELELRKGGVYMVTERCQDGWFKGTSNRTQKCGVFPGNYVTPAVAMPRSPQPQNSEPKSAVSYTRSSKSGTRTSNLPPELPPRATSPSANAISSSWHGQQDSAAVPLGRSSSAIMSSVNLTVTPAKASDKPKERKEKGTVSLMRRLTSIKCSKSPPPSSYSMDNPVFEDTTVSTSHPVHVRSGSCPSQLLQAQPVEHHRFFQSSSQRLKLKERSSVLTHARSEVQQVSGSATSSPNVHHHRKSHSLDAGNRTKTGTQTKTMDRNPPDPNIPNAVVNMTLEEIGVTAAGHQNIPHIGFVVGSSTDDIPPPKADFSAPPPYEVATKLPTYEEVQREKSLEGQAIQHTLPQTRAPEFRQPGQRILAIDAEANDDVDTSLLGTDFMFYTAFFVAFIFNWIGFLLLMCFCHTIASRYGALSGFGLSLAKWTLIVKHSTDLASRDNSWLWWLIMTFGLIICIRAILQYLSIKRGWRMLTASHQERLLFFY